MRTDMAARAGYCSGSWAACGFSVRAHGPRPSFRARLTLARTKLRPADISVSEESVVIILGAILLIIGFVAGIPILWTIGLIVLVVGLILMLLGATGRAVGGRRHYY